MNGVLLLLLGIKKGVSTAVYSIYHFSCIEFEAMAISSLGAANFALEALLSCIIRASE